MSRTYSGTPSKVQIQPGGSDNVLCSGHKRKAVLLTAGPSSKNPGRKFYTCALSRDDPERCKFFKWEDEETPATPSRQTPQQVSQQTPTPRTAPTDKKRKLDDTPLVDNDNPFLSSSQEDIHPLASSSIAAIRDLSAHLNRQDRLLIAAEKMKEGLRKKIQELKASNEALEARVKELESKLA